MNVSIRSRKNTSRIFDQLRAKKSPTLYWFSLTSYDKERTLYCPKALGALWLYLKVLLIDWFTHLFISLYFPHSHIFVSLSLPSILHVCQKPSAHKFFFVLLTLKMKVKIMGIFSTKKIIPKYICLNILCPIGYLPIKRVDKFSQSPFQKKIRYGMVSNHTYLKKLESLTVTHATFYPFIYSTIILWQQRVFLVRPKKTTFLHEGHL